MKIKLFTKVSALLALLSTIMVTSVYASWLYAEFPPQNIEQSLGLNMAEFIYTPEEVLPGHEVGTLGENHQEVIYNITDHIKYGLNYQQKPLLSNYLEQNGVVYSNQKATGGNLKFLGDESESLMWVIKKETDTEYSIYTFANEYVTSSNLNLVIAVFKTKCVYENGLWVNVRAFVGEAPIARVSGIITIDINEWKEMK